MPGWARRFEWARRWSASRATLGGATSRPAIPSPGEVDAPTLKLLGRYRQDVESTEPLPFGIYGRVIEPGFVRVGDAVAVEG